MFGGNVTGLMRGKSAVTDLETGGAAENKTEFTEGNAYQSIIPNFHTICHLNKNVLMIPTGLP